MKRVAIAIVMFISAGLARGEDSVRSLAGTWRFMIDAADSGVTDRVFERDLADQIQLPGSVDEAAKVNNPDKPNLNRLYRPHLFIGVAWYQRDCDVPAEWSGKYVELFLERSHWETQIWLDGHAAGTRDSLVTPHEFGLGEIKPGKHRLTIRVDNRLKHMLGYGPLGPNMFGTGTHELSEDTQTNWNGIVGRIELRALEAISIEHVRVEPPVSPKSIAVRVELVNRTGQNARGKVRLEVLDRDIVVSKSVEFAADDTACAINAELDCQQLKLWDEFSPAVYQLRATIEGQSGSSVTTFGLRSFERDGTQLAVNRRKIFLRGTVNCCEFPLTGYPPTDDAAWRRIFGICKEYGLNFMRFHSWTPPDAAFTAADDMGFYLLVEAPAWVHDIGRNKDRDRFILEEAKRTLRVYGNHPSFCLYTFGNELSGDLSVLDRFQQELMKLDARHLYSWNTGSVARKRLPSEQFFTGSNSNGKLIRTYGKRASTSDDYRDATQSDPVPLIAHEIGQYMVYPDLAQIPKYTGALSAANLELVRDDLSSKGILDQSTAFTRASGEQSLMLYRAEVEVSLRTAGLAGFALLGLADYPGQGTSTIGLLDAFWDRKDYVDPKLWRKSCSPIVPLLRMPKRVYSTDETFKASVDVSNFSAADLADAALTWRVSDAKGNAIGTGQLASRNLPTGALTSVGEFELSLAKVPAPAKLTCTVSVGTDVATNSWELWVYPAEIDSDPPADVVVTSDWPEARAALVAGKRTVLMLTPMRFEKGLVLPWETAFWSPVFWGKTELVTYGGAIDASHPIFNQFPTDGYRGWQWKDVFSKGAIAMRLDELPPEFKAIEQPIDNHGRNRRLGDLFEARVGSGKLLVCGFDLSSNLRDRPAARQLRNSVYNYITSDRFAPKSELDLATLDSLFTPKNGSSN